MGFVIGFICGLATFWLIQRINIIFNEKIKEAFKDITEEEKDDTEENSFNA